MPCERAAVFLLLATVVSSCAPTRPVKKGPPPPDPIKTTEQLAYEAERRINSAESELASLQPDRAVEQLDAAQKMLIDSKIDAYPDAELLRSRHRELLDRVPVVREEVRKRELAAAVADAHTKIDAASATLKDAIERIKRKRPEEADLKAAEEAVSALDSAVEEASKCEPQDRDYAKYALETRKQLSGQRKQVAERRLQVAIELSREAIAAASSELEISLKGLRSRDVMPAEFESARGAAGKVQAAIEGANDLIVKDLGFAKQISAARKKLDAQRALIDKREHEVSVERQRVAIEQSRKTLKENLTRLKNKDIVEADFTEADAAVGGVEKLLADGAALAANDVRYAAYASSVKSKVDDAKAWIVTRRLEVAIAKQKGEIETARIALGEALFRLNGKAPVEGEFEAARNGVVAVEKTLDAAEPLMPKDRTFSRYVLDVRRGLQGARNRIEQRKFDVELGQQRAKVNAALAEVKQASARLVEPAEFEQAEKLVGELESTLDAGETFASRDRAYGKMALDARKSASQARRHIRERKEEVAVENQKAKVSAALASMKSAIDPLDGFSPGEDQFKAATDSIEAAGRALDEGAELERTVGRYKSWSLEARKKISAATSRVEKRRTQIEVRERKLLVENGLASLKSALAAVRNKDATGDQVKEAGAALGTVRDELSKGTDLEIED